MTRETKLILLCVALAALIVYSVVVGQMEVKRQNKLIQQIERQQRETSETIHRIEQDKVTTDTIKKTIEELPQTYRDRARHYGWEQADRRGGNYIGRYEAKLAGTPMEGLGRTIYLAELDAGIPPKYVVAQAILESGGGRHLAGSYNAWGRRALPSGWMNFDSWEDGIDNQVRYMAREYFNKGRTDEESIAAKYAPKSDGNVGYGPKLRAMRASI